MIANNIFSCYIIGDDNITLQCANIVLANGHKIKGLVSSSRNIQEWCNENLVLYISDIKDFEENYMVEECDFIFSISNGHILSDSILQYPNSYAINYHNGPLPKYAGLYATSWAILNGETEHAISWHKMKAKVDAGDILKQPWFSIDEDDTALSLNLKCYEHAVLAFRELICDLATNAAISTRQNLTNRSYYSLKDKPKNFGFISWKETSENIDRLCRAFTFGNYLNELITPKIVVNNEIVVVKSFRKLGISSGGDPGRIVHISNNELQITTGTTDIAIYELLSLSGEEYELARLVNNHALSVGQHLTKIAHTYFQNLFSSAATHPKKEKFWVNEHLKCVRGGTEFLSQLITLNDSRHLSSETKKTITISKIILDKINKNFPSLRGGTKHVLFSVILIYLYRINNYINLTISYSYPILKLRVGELNNFLADYIPFTTNFNSEMAFSEALSHLVKEDARLANYETYSKDIFVRYPEIRRLTNEIEISISFFDTKKETLSFAGDKKLNIYISDDGSCVHIHNNTNYRAHEESYQLFNKMEQHLSTLLEDVIADPNKKIFELALIDEEEKNYLMHVCNATYREYDHKKLLHSYIEEQVVRTPDALAAVFDGTSISFGELNQKSNKLANYLVELGVMPNEIVGIYLHRSLEMLISILGVIKSGGAYLPLDPHYPDKRVKYMLDNSQSKFLLTQRTSINKHLYGYDGLTIDIDEVLNKKQLSCLAPPVNNNSSDLAYVIYTSGTTGAPKGVAIAHQAACNHMVWMWNEYNFQKRDNFLLKTPFSFDASVWEIFMPLIVGGKLIIAPDDSHASPRDLIQLVRKHKISILQLVPSMLREMTLTQGFGECSTLRHIFCGGEVLLPETIHAFFEHNIFGAKLHNLYGPTETTINAITQTCTPKDAISIASLIGKPISNTKVYILDNKMQLVPTGVLGELYISGDGLARGYINNLTLTQQKFLQHPFSTQKMDRVYKTGDLVKWQHNGSIEYHGRSDSQIKIRGFRIEISEIESCLEKISSIYQCVVKPEPNQDGSLSLSAYIVLMENVQISAFDIRSALKKDIPDYMVPTRFFVVDKLLTTPTGKLDRKSPLIPSRQLYLGQEHLAPRNTTESLLHNIWCSVLKTKKLSINDDFFELGGHSLSAMQIIAQVQEHFSIKLTIRKLFDFPTISCLSKEIDKLKSTGSSVQINCGLSESIIIPIKKSGNKIPLFLIHPIGGSIFWYKSLGIHLDLDRPLYGIQDPGLEKKELFFESLEAMAKSYVEGIKTIQPHGPYILGGASFGSTVAVEMAKQLQEKNEKILAIISMDGWAEYPAIQSNESNFKTMMRKQNARVLKQHIENNIVYSDFLLDLQWHREKMLMHYKLPRINAKLILFKAKVLTELFNYDAPLNWWDSYSNQPIECHLVPGDHESMFYEPNVKILGGKINDILHEKNIFYPEFNVD